MAPKEIGSGEMDRPAATKLRERERAALERLRQGCWEDIASSAWLLARPLRAACEELRDEIAGTGRLDADVSRSLRAQRAEEIAVACVRKVFANADVRFRARFAIYAHSLQDAQSETLPAGRRLITIPHLALEDADAVVPHFAPTLDDIAEWRNELERSIAAALGAALEAALHTIAERGLASLSRSRIAIYRSE